MLEHETDNHSGEHCCNHPPEDGEATPSDLLQKSTADTRHSETTITIGPRSPSDRADLASTAEQLRGVADGLASFGRRLATETAVQQRSLSAGPVAALNAARTPP